MIRILSLGTSQVNHVVQLYQAVKSINPNIEYDIDGIFRFSDSISYDENNIFSHQYNFQRDVTSNKIKRFWVLFKNSIVLFRMFVLKDLLFLMAVHPSFIMDYIYGTLIGREVVRKKILPLKHDIYHFHFCTYYSLRFIDFLPATAKIICSFWGSDLLRNSSEFEFHFVTRYLYKATIISTGQYEVQQIILAKYGRDLFSKLREANFIGNLQLHQLINQFRNEEKRKQDFKRKYGIPENNYVIMIGHNASPSNNHELILQEIESFFSQNKAISNVTCVIPLTYGGPQEYIESLKQRCEHSLLSITIIDKFLDWEEMTLLRLVTDILLFMPESDLLSGTIRELLHAGNILVAGGWLPYSKYDEIGFFFYKARNFKHIEMILYLIFYTKGIEQVKVECNKNPHLVETNLYPENLAKDWVNVYYQLHGTAK